MRGIKGYEYFRFRLRPLGSFHSWYANHIGHVVTLWGRESSANLKRLKKHGKTIT